MKSKKLARAIASLTLGVVTATGLCLGVAGCGHKHKYAEEWSKDAENHWHAATCEHTDEKSDVAAHVDENSDGKCDVCEFTMAVAVTGVTLDKPTAEMTVGGSTLTLQATVAPSNATNKAVSWSSSDATVATVANGVVTAKAAGTATITVTTSDGSKTATCVVTVKPAQGGEETVAVTGVKLDKSTAEMVVGGNTLTLTATVEPEGATNKKVTWSSSDETIATVADGVVTAKKDGTVTITVTTEDGSKTAECVITVKPAQGGEETVAVTGVALKIGDADAGEGGNLAIGESLTLVASLSPEDATNKTVSWSSSDDTKATVADGVVTAKAAGDAVITVTTADGSFTDTYKVHVESKYEQLVEKGTENNNIIIASGFDEFPDDQVGVEAPQFNGYYGEMGLAYINKGTNTAGKVIVAQETTNKYISVVDPGDNSEVNCYFVCGPTKGALEGYVEVTLHNSKGSWTPVRITSETGGELFRIRTDGTVFKYSIDGGATYISGVNDIKFADAKFAIYYTVTEDGVLAMTINGDEFAKDVQLDIAGKGNIAAMMFVSSNGGKAMMDIDNVVVLGTLQTGKEFAATAKAYLDTEYAKMTDETTGTHKLNAAAIKAIYDEKVAVFEKADATLDEVNAAALSLDGFDSDADIAAEQEKYAQQLQDWQDAKGNYTHSGEEIAEYNNQEAYANAVDAAQQAVDNATSVSDVNSAISYYQGVLSEIMTDEQCLAHKREKLVKEITNYVPVGYDELMAKDDAEVPQAKKDEVDAAISKLRTDAQNDINAGAWADLDGIVSKAQTEMDSAVAHATKTAADVKETEKTTLETNVETMKTNAGLNETDDATLWGNIATELQNGKAAIDAVDGSAAASAVTAVRNEYETKIELMIAKDSAIKEVDAYAETLKSQLIQQEAKDSIVVSQESQDAINNAADKEAVAAAITAAKEALDTLKTSADGIDKNNRKSYNEAVVFDVVNTHDYSQNTPEIDSNGKDASNKTFSTETFTAKMNENCKTGSWLTSFDKTNGRIQTKSGYLDMYTNVEANKVGSTFTVKVYSADATFIVDYGTNGTNSTRYLRVKDANGDYVALQELKDGTKVAIPTYDDPTDPADNTTKLTNCYNQPGITGKVICLPNNTGNESTTYTFEFYATDATKSKAKEHKIVALTLNDKQEQQVTGVVNGVKATAVEEIPAEQPADLKTLVSVKLDIEGTEDETVTHTDVPTTDYTVTLAEGETWAAGKVKLLVQYNDGIATANKYNSVVVEITVPEAAA